MLGYYFWNRFIGASQVVSGSQAVMGIISLDDGARESIAGTLQIIMLGDSFSVPVDEYGSFVIEGLSRKQVANFQFVSNEGYSYEPNEMNPSYQVVVPGQSIMLNGWVKKGKVAIPQEVNNTTLSVIQKNIPSSANIDSVNGLRLQFSVSTVFGVVQSTGFFYRLSEDQQWARAEVILNEVNFLFTVVIPAEVLLGKAEMQYLITARDASSNITWSPAVVGEADSARGYHVLKLVQPPAAVSPSGS
jgi:hypothetical protein